MNAMLAKRLKQLRVAANLQQNDIIKRLSLSSARYSQYESGKRRPDYELLIEFADLYGVSIDYLLGRTTIQNYPTQTSPAYSSDELDLIRKYRALDETRQEAVRDFIDASYAKALTSQKNTAELVS